MTRLIAFIILLSHLNFTMFIPSVDEFDMYYANGSMVDDINSVQEYLDEVFLGNIDTTPEDEDQDKPGDLQVRTLEYVFYYSPRFIEYVSQPIVQKTTILFSPFNMPKHLGPSYDIISPPPQA